MQNKFATPIFDSREQAAELLAKQLQPLKGHDDVVVIAIPRGALPMGSIIAKALDAPLDVVLTKKIGAPHNKELAIGAVSRTGYSMHPKYKEFADPHYIHDEVERLQKLLATREEKYRAERDQLDLTDKIVIVVDDGAATGRTFIETLKVIRSMQPTKIIAAIPVAPPDTVALIQGYAEEILVLLQPKNFRAVSQFYRSFPEVSDEQAISILHQDPK